MAQANFPIYLTEARARSKVLRAAQSPRNLSLFQLCKACWLWTTVSYNFNFPVFFFVFYFTTFITLFGLVDSKSNISNKANIWSVAPSQT